MNYRIYDEPLATLQEALEYMTSSELKDLAALTGQRVPARKGDIVALIAGHLAGERLRTAWQVLDELQQAAVAEVVHSRQRGFSRSVSGQIREGSELGFQGHIWLRSQTIGPAFFLLWTAGAGRSQGRLARFVPAPAGGIPRHVGSASLRVCDRVPSLECGKA